MQFSSPAMIRPSWHEQIFHQEQACLWISVYSSSNIPNTPVQFFKIIGNAKFAVFLHVNKW